MLLTLNHLAMINLDEPEHLWESFKLGRTEAFHYFFRLHYSRIYYYLLQLLRDQEQAREATKHAFIMLFHHRAQIQDADHVLRRLYLNARVGYLLRLKGRTSFWDLEKVVDHYTHKDSTIMDDPEVAQNETLLALQEVLRKLPPLKRAVAELYFFQGFSIGAIAQQLQLDEAIVRAIISETLKHLG